MRFVDSLKQRLTRLLTAPGEELGRWARILRFQIQLWRFCARRLRENNAMAMSAALSFRTLFAMVPTIILVFLVMKPLGIIEDNKQLLHTFLAESGLSQISHVRRPRSQPASGPSGTEPEGGREISVADRIESLVDRVEGSLTVGRLGPIGVVLLIWAALTLLTTIERSLNRIFEAPRSRSLVRRVLLYWSVLTLGPLVLFTAAYAGGKAVAAFRSAPVLSWVIVPIGWAGPPVVGLLFLACVYKLTPNTHVRFRSALGGAIVAVPLWMVVRWAFAQYVDHVGLHSLYGAMGLVPLFLLWLNLSWWIFLFGAQLAHTAANLSRMQAAGGSDRNLLGPWDLLAAAVAVARGHLSGEGPVPIDRVARQLQLPDASAAWLMGRLLDRGVVCRVAGQRARDYVLARSPQTIAVSEILRIGCPDGCGASGRNCAPEIADTIAQVRRRAEAGLENLTVADIISK